MTKLDEASRSPTAEERRRPLLQLKSISKRFSKPQDAMGKFARKLGFAAAPETVHAVDGVDLDIHEGEVVGLVGESGCGKSTLGRLAIGLLRPSDGERLWRGKPLQPIEDSEDQRSQLSMQMVFQDPMASLNPRLRVLDIVGEAPVVHGIVSRRQQVEYVAEQLNQVGLDPAVMKRFPHQFSGGQRARIGIARALAVKPRFIVCDESVAALDVSIQAQVLNLFMELRRSLDLTYLFISHDLGVVKHISDRVVIMYLGRVVEMGVVDEIFARPLHPYTEALLSGIADTTPGKRQFVPIRGEIPSPINPPSGCHFHPRCPKAMPRCAQSAPGLLTRDSGQSVACHLFE